MGLSRLERSLEFNCIPHLFAPLNAMRVSHVETPKEKLETYSTFNRDDTTQGFDLSLKCSQPLKDAVYNDSNCCREKYPSAIYAPKKQSMCPEQQMMSEMDFFIHFITRNEFSYPLKPYMKECTFMLIGAPALENLPITTRNSYF